MLTRSFFSDQTKLFMEPEQCMPGDRMRIRFRAMENSITSLVLLIDDKKIKMSREFNHNEYDYYSTHIIAGKNRMHYCFEIHCGTDVYYYGRKGMVHERLSVTEFEIIPGFIIPEWLKGAVMYQIFPDRFYNGDPANNTKDGEYEYLGKETVCVKDWNELPKTFDVVNFYGGDLMGIEKKLDYLSWLGIEVIYLNPVFLSPSNHKYDVMDYDHIDPHLARLKPEENASAQIYLEDANDYFKTFMEKCHAKGIRVILDGVFNHCSHYHKWMDAAKRSTCDEPFERGAFENPDSRYHDYFIFQNGECSKYECWRGNENLPKLNYEGSKELVDDIMRISGKWVSEPYNIDGWRLDVAADLGHSREFNHDFWQKFRNAVKAANPDAVIIAEHYEDAKPWLDGKQWDTIMNYKAFMEPVSLFFTGMEKHSDWFDGSKLGNAHYFADIMINNAARMPFASLYTAMNQLDNHDHSRFLTRTNHRVGRLENLGSAAAEENTKPHILRLAVMLQMTWPGAPCIYYGDEVGVCGFTDPDNRRTYPWGGGDSDLLNFHREMIRLRKYHPMLKDSSCRIVVCENGILAYARFTRDEQIIAVFSMAHELRGVSVPIWLAGIERSSHKTTLRTIMKSDRQGYSVFREKVVAKHGILRLELEPESAVIFVTGKGLHVHG